jgi:phage host-nuclease inhibitor protein Gam
METKKDNFMTEATAETKAGTQETKDYTFAQKAAFIETMQGQLAEMRRDLDHISSSIETSTAAIKAEAHPKHQALREQTAKLHKQLDAAITATESTWDDVKAGSRTAYNDLKTGFRQTRQWVSDKIAP